MSLTIRQQMILKQAARILEKHLIGREVLGSPQLVKNYLRTKLYGLEHEVFMAIFLDSQNRAIASEILFTGTLTSTSVYPREVVKAALRYNAAGIMFAHNHPSGVTEPSLADEALTRALKQSLALVDVRVIDHFVCAAGGVLSFAETGKL